MSGLVIAVGSGAWLIYSGGKLARVPWWVWALFPSFLAAAGLQCLRTARKLSGSDRKVWTCFGVGLLAEAMGEAMWAIHDLTGGGPAPFPVIAYAAYFSYSILSIAGFWYCMPSARSARVPLVQLGNLATVVSAILLAYVFLFYGFLRSPFPIALSLIAIGYCILGLTAFLFGSIVASLRLSGRIRWVMFLMLIGVGTIAITDYHFTYIVLHAEYLKTDPLNIAYLAASSFFIWAAFERSQLPAVIHSSEAALRVDDRARLWETLLLPLAVASVLVIALMFRERLTSDLLPYVAGASAFFVISLALRNWWAQQLENRLRLQALASESELQVANRELLNEMKSRSRAEE
ncbi:MAG TPA: hypothetical protein VEC18_05150, partial [Myxococcota bacterium]|nr:hypothetical protein [Myxococcota bacterium]